MGVVRGWISGRGPFPQGVDEFAEVIAGAEGTECPDHSVAVVEAGSDRRAEGLHRLVAVALGLGRAAGDRDTAGQLLGRLAEFDRMAGPEPHVLTNRLGRLTGPAEGAQRSGQVDEMAAQELPILDDLRMAVERRALVGDRLTVLRDRLLVSAEVGENQSKVVQGPAQDALIICGG